MHRRRGPIDPHTERFRRGGMRTPSIAGSARIVATVTGEACSAHVRTNVGMTQRFPPGEPRVPALSSPAGDDDEVRNHQENDEQPDCDEDAGPEIHSSAPSLSIILSCNLRSAAVGPGSGCNLRTPDIAGR